MVGAIVFATHQGLGYLAKDFYDNGIIDKVYIIPHRHRENNYTWYKNEDKVTSPEGLLDCDTILMFETPIEWGIIKDARNKGIKTILMPMYECTQYPLRYVPDMTLAASDLDLQYYPESERINVPVPNWVKWKERKTAKVFVHNAGNGGIGGRNGTDELVEAMKYVKSPIKLIIRSQTYKVESDDDRIEIRRGTVPESELYDEGDVFIFPEKFNGLSLPMQEAFASGMPVMCGNRFPMNTWLPKEIMIPVDGYKREQLGVAFDMAIYDPKSIAMTIDSWYGKDISKLSLLGKKFKEENSWKKLKEKYEELMSV